MRRKIGNILFAIAMVVMVCCIFILFFGEGGILRSKPDPAAEQAGESADVEGMETADKAESTGDGTESDIAASGREEENEGDVQEQSEPEEPAQPSEGTSQMSPNETESNLVFSMGNDSDAARFLTQDVIDQVAAVNQGESLAEVTGMEELEGYYALTTMHVILARDAETGEEAAGSGTLSLYVPNLLSSLKDVSALYYDFAGKQWRLIPIDVVDAPGKRVSMTLNGPGMVTTIYRMEK